MLTAFAADYGRSGRHPAGLRAAGPMDSGCSDGRRLWSTLKELGGGQAGRLLTLPSHATGTTWAGAPAIIQAMKPAAIYTGRRMQDRLLALASGSEEKAAVRDAYYRVLAPGDAFWLGPARFECLGPEKLNKYSVGAVGENYNSLILRLEYGARTMLFTGSTSASKRGDIPDEKLALRSAEKSPSQRGAGEEAAEADISPDRGGVRQALGGITETDQSCRSRAVYRWEKATGG